MCIRDSFFVSADARALIRQEGIILLSYRPIQEVWKVKRDA